MKKYCLIPAVFLLSLSFALAKADNWLTFKSTHFIVYYKNAPDDFIDHLVEKAEGYYNDIADDLGLRRYNFWLWDNRAKIYIHDDAKAYQDATGQPSWSAGCAQTKNKVIHSFPNAQGFLDTTLPHEMGHIIFRELVGFDNYAVPLWLDEGVASYQERSRRLLASQAVKEAVKAKTLIPAEELFNISLRGISNYAKVDLFYAESLNIVNYLIKEYGKDYFVLFCQILRDKKNLDQAIRRAYPFNNSQKLAEAWQAYVGYE